MQGFFLETGISFMGEMYMHGPVRNFKMHYFKNTLTSINISYSCNLMFESRMNNFTKPEQEEAFILIYKRI